MSEKPSFAEAFKVWFKIGCLSFGGPAGQIALMHRVVVDEKKWLPESRFLHALNFCMLLPGPEAQQLATYTGWLLHGVRGGLAAGILFVLPGAVVMLGLSLLYVYGRGVGVVDGALFGIKAAVLVIVVEALIRIGKRALKSPLLLAIAALAFIGIFTFALPFPLIVAGAALIGYLAARYDPASMGIDETSEAIDAARKGALAASGDRHAHRFDRVVGAGRSCRCRARTQPCPGVDWIVFLQARGGHVRRRLCGARLHGAASGRDPWLADRAGNGGRARLS